MSAWMFSEKQINYLVSYAVDYDVSFYDDEFQGHIQAIDNPQYFVDVLTKANCDSLIARYGTNEKQLKYKFQHTKILAPIEILKNCNCFDYQACEVNRYRYTPAYRMINDIRGAAIRNLPGYDKASWGGE